jgi:DNA-binding transcriptional ArsR family regulator
MPAREIELFLHPIRLRILLTLAVDTLTTQEIADRLPDVPKSSIYRHLKILLDAGLVVVAETRPVKGVEEKVYKLVKMPYVDSHQAARLAPDELARYCATFLATVLHDFNVYLQATPHLDLARDRAGFTETIFYATDAEFDQAIGAFNAAIVPLTANGPGAGRRRRKLASVAHPVPDPPPSGADHC